MLYLFVHVCSTLHFYLIAVDADPSIRFERITRRKSALDNVSFDKFLSDEAREMNSPDPTKGNIAECVRRADFVVKNEGSIEDLRSNVDLFLPNILNLPK